ncbi:LysM peptidoglycan-binding domain-containing protein [Methanosarcina sp. DH2]|uniref:CIS tube protein n=1 Tax=Methanosarcina sp. DH2 TaxID=2605639 RepID=UPI001E5D84F1|nr:LysM peptidoglycan-binding domain-containing protein [Methanosarcina sp. DH2]MCC4769567.1 LysM peptidoglycan-binding domain-containing protein [Methanosarcina sp. DH2]
MKQKPKKGFIEIFRGGKGQPEQIEILYFPPEYSIDKSNSFSEISVPGLESPYLQYIKGNSGSISLEVFYDTYEEGGVDVRKYTDQLTGLMNIDPELHAPPVLRFIWGLVSKEPFYCVLEKVTRRFTMFNSDGIPVRAKLNITLKEFKVELNNREKSLQSPDKTHVYTAKQGDSLWLIAYREYGDPGLWRPIALANKIEHPELLKPGTELIIPPVE